MRRRWPIFAAATIALFVAASLAWAALPGLQRVTKTSTFNSTASNQGGPDCPTGKQLLGAGGRVRSSSGPSSWIGTLQSGEAGLDEITPLPDLSGTSVVGVEIGTGPSANWAAQGYAICETYTVAHRLTLSKAASPADSVAVKSVTATCPAGKKVVGAGGQNNAPTGKVVLDEITPLMNLSGVTAVGVETANGTTENWRVVAYAICANAPNVPGLELVSNTSTLDSNSYKYTYVDCPAGKKVTGAGGGINTTATGKVVLTGIAVHGGPAPRVSAFGAETSGGTTGNWEVNVYAICATP